MWNSWRSGGIIYNLLSWSFALMPCRWSSKREQLRFKILCRWIHHSGISSTARGFSLSSFGLFILLQSFARLGLECSKFETLKISPALKESLEKIPVRPSSNLRRLILRTLRVVRNGNIEFQLTFPLLTHIFISSLFITQRDWLRLIRCFEMLEFGSFALQQDQQFTVEASFDTRSSGFPQAAAFSPRVGPSHLYKSSRIQSTIPT
jgi:hypothetical protein